MTADQPVHATTVAVRRRGAWQAALELTCAARPGPVALVLSRQKLPLLDPKIASAQNVARGAYVVRDGGASPAAVLLATGAEVHLALAAAQRMAAEGVEARVVSMPSWELFERQDAGWRDAVLPPAVRARVSVEAASSFGWRRWVGELGECVAVDRFGLSAPGEEALAAAGVSVEAVVKAAVKAVRRVRERGSAG